MWSASGVEEGENKSRVSTISLGRLQYIRWVTAGPTRKTKTKVSEKHTYRVIKSLCAPDDYNTDNTNITPQVFLASSLGSV
jgi:hypothetical protein